MKSKGVAIGANPRYGFGVLPTATYTLAGGGTTYAEFNAFAFNDLEYNGVVDAGGQTALPVRGVGSRQGVDYKFSTGEDT